MFREARPLSGTQLTTVSHTAIYMGQCLFSDSENPGSPETLRHSVYNNPSYTSTASFGSFASAASSRSSVTSLSSFTRPTPYPQSNRKHFRQSPNTTPDPTANQNRNHFRSRRGTESTTSNHAPFDIHTFNQQFPKYSTLLPAMYSTAISLAFALDNSSDWPEGSTERKPSPLLGYARLAIEIIVQSHLEDPRGVDISAEGNHCLCLCEVCY
jgi:hypothetical protein